MRVGIAQIAPVVLDREATLDRVVTRIEEAGAAGCDLVAFGETVIPGYPFWLARTGGARFEDPAQKAWYARYVAAAVDVAGGGLRGVQAAARRAGCAVVLGVAERATDRGGHSVFASRVFLDREGGIGSVHRKLVPTHEERLVWAPGDAHGLVTHEVRGARVSALNCWENWMPLARAALYAQGTEVHVMLWPGSTGLTRELTRFVAREGRCFVVSAGALLREADLPPDLPEREALARPGETLYDGGSAAAGPDGGWILEPRSGEEGLFVVDLDVDRVAEERQSFDPAGHYARPELLSLLVDRRRPTTARFRET